MYRVYPHCVYDWYYKRSEHNSGSYVFVLMWIKKMITIIIVMINNKIPIKISMQILQILYVSYID